MNKNEFQKSRRQKLKDQGLCVSCGKCAPRDSLQTCETCGKNLSKNMTRWKQKIRQERSSSGLCSCGKSVTKGKTCDECKEKNRNWYYRRKDMSQCTYCGNKTIDGKTRCEKCSEEHVRKNRELKLEVYEAYGGATCKCCKETTECFLTIDHINNDGAEHRKQIGRTSILRWLKQNNYPDGFQVLCFNCNLGRRLNGGICPHQIN